MNKKDFFLVGNVSSKFGKDNSAILKLDTDSIEPYLNLDSIFVEINKTLIPIFLIKTQVRNTSEIVITLDPDTDLKPIIGCKVYLPLTKLPDLGKNKFYYHEIVGYTVQDQSLGKIGIIDSVLDFPHQQILSIFNDKKEILIPLVNDFYISIDKKSKTIHLNVPEGLVEIYLNEKKNEEEE